MGTSTNSATKIQSAFVQDRDLDELLGSSDRLASNLETALAHAKAGRPVFPCRPDKTPLVKWRDLATCDPHKIRQWWHQYPNAMPGLPMGQASGLAVLDLDIRPDKDGIAALCDLDFDPDTLSPCIVTTPSGGRHLYFRCPKGLGNSADHLPAGIDVRGEGGYVIAPGAIAEAGAYSFASPSPDDLPAWPEALRRDAPAPVTNNLAELLGDDDDDLLRDHFDAKWADDLPRTLSALKTIPANLRHSEWARIGMALHHGSAGSDEGFRCWYDWSQTAPDAAEDMNRRGERAWRNKWNSFATGAYKGQTVKLGTLFHVAKGYGWNPAAPIPGSDDDLEELLGTSKPAEDWQAELDRDKDGRLKSTPYNVGVILRHDPKVAGTFTFNAFGNRIDVARRPDLPGDFWQPGPLADIHAKGIKAWLTSARKRGGWGLSPSTETLHDSIALVARDRAFHPIREWLTRETHDGRPRVDTLFIDYLGAPGRAYFREAARCTLVAAVARVFEPGHKFDFVPILEGAQGIRKSTFVRTLGGDWAGDPTISDWGNPQKVMEQIAGFWIIEIGELAGMYRGEVSDLKAGVSKTADTARLAYGHNPETVPRQCVFIGTTNDSEYLKDATGNRRFWPIPCDVPQIDTERLKAELPQIWAEAVAIYRAMRDAKPDGDLPLYLRSDEAKAEALELQGSRKLETAEEMLAARIAAWVEEPVEAAEGADELDPAAPQQRRDFVCALSVWHGLLGHGEGRTPSKAESILIGQALSIALQGKSWRKGRETAPRYGRVQGYRRSGTCGL